MREYELTVVLLPELNDEEQKKLLKMVEELVASLKGKILRNFKLGLKDLAYVIGKNNRGFFYRWELSLPEEKAKEVDKKLKTEQRIIRYLFLRKE